MKTEMDLLRFDERQRLAWLLANRGTVIAVGVIWIGIIVWELAQGRVPLFMIAAVPVIALLRVGLFFYYNAAPGDAVKPSRGFGLGDALKALAALMMVVALLLPLYGVAGLGGADSAHRVHTAWSLVSDDWTLAIPLAVAFLWPLPVWLLMRRPFARRFLVLTQWAEPLLAVASVLFILWLPHVLFEFQQIFWFVFVLMNAEPQTGCYIAVAANGIYVTGWLSAVLRHSVSQP